MCISSVQQQDSDFRFSICQGTHLHSDRSCSSADLLSCPDPVQHQSSIRTRSELSVLLPGTNSCYKCRFLLGIANNAESNQRLCIPPYSALYCFTVLQTGNCVGGHCHDSSAGQMRSLPLCILASSLGQAPSLC